MGKVDDDRARYSLSTVTSDEGNRREIIPVRFTHLVSSSPAAGKLFAVVLLGVTPCVWLAALRAAHETASVLGANAGGIFDRAMITNDKAVLLDGRLELQPGIAQEFRVTRCVMSLYCSSQQLAADQDFSGNLKGRITVSLRMCNTLDRKTPVQRISRMSYCLKPMPTMLLRALEPTVRSLRARNSFGDLVIPHGKRRSDGHVHIQILVGA